MANTAIHSYTQLYQEPTTLVGSWLYIAAALRKLLSWPHIKRVALFWSDFHIGQACIGALKAVENQEHLSVECRVPVAFSLPSSCVAFSQAFTVNPFEWRETVFPRRDIEVVLTITVESLGIFSQGESKSALQQILSRFIHKVGLSAWAGNSWNCESSGYVNQR